MQGRQLCFFLLLSFFFFLPVLEKDKSTPACPPPPLPGLQHWHSPVEFDPGSQDAALWRLFWNPFSCLSVEATLAGKSIRLERIYQGSVMVLNIKVIILLVHIIPLGLQLWTWYEIGSNSNWLQEGRGWQTNTWAASKTSMCLKLLSHVPCKMILKDKGNGK